MKRILLILLSGMLLAGTGFAKELKLAFVDSDKILEASDDYKQARQKLQEEEKEYITKASNMERTAKTMKEEIDAQSLMLSDSAKNERRNKLMKKLDELEAYRKEVWGDGGKLYTKNLELSRPVLDKINGAIQKLSQEEGYDFVFDASSANIVFALPEHDITDRVIELLKKE
jgi:outer membrane protein